MQPTATSSSQTSAPSDEREALKDSERAASERQPGSFKDRETDDKIVSIPPVGEDKEPIRGLDPA